SLLRHCLEKDPHRRLRDIGDAGIEISETLSSLTANLAIVEEAQPAGLRRLMVVGLVCLVLGSIVTGLVTWSLTGPAPPPSQPLTRFVVHPVTTIGEEALWHHALAISPDGKHLAYVDAGEGGGRLLYLRSMDEFKAKPLPGTEGAISPFFSPDGEWIGFYDKVKKKLKKIAVKGGTPTTLCEPQDFIGGSWGPDDTIIFAIERRGLWRCTVSGEMEELTVLDANQGEWGHIYPQVLPRGDTVLFTNCARWGVGPSRMEVLLLETGERRVLLEDGIAVRYVPTGHLVFVRGNTLYAVPFDLDELRVTDTPQPFPLAGDIRVGAGASGQFAFSENGALVYLPAPLDKRSLVWVDRRGVVEPVGVLPRPYTCVRISPDGNRLAATISPQRLNSDIWILDKDRLTHRQLTFDGNSFGVIWTQDGKRVIFTFLSKDSTLSVPMWMLADGSGEAVPLAEAKQLAEKPGLRFWVTYCLSPDGEYLLGGANSIWMLPMEGKGDARPFAVKMDSHQRHPAFSSNGRWGAAVSRTGRHNEDFDRRRLRTALVTGRQRVVLPLWRQNDGRDDRFIMIQEDEESAKTRINVVLNWFEELKRLVPTGKD
ncbi:MAG: TolB family protein, partial [Planctomycetota bacterium]